MSNIPPINDKLFLEAYNIISSNKSKANSLRQSLLQNISCDNDPNSKVIGFLGELEYDLKSLYDIIKDIQFSQNDNQDNYYNEPINEEKKGIGKTYSITSEKSGNGNKNNFSKINNYYINSPMNKESNKAMQRSSSCNEFLNNNEENKNNVNLVRNRYNYLHNLKERENKSSSKVLSPKLNFDYDAYFTDYSLNKTSKNSFGSYINFLDKNNNNNSNNNIEKSPNINYEMDNNKDDLNNNEINNYNNYKNKNIFTFSEQKNKSSKEELNNNMIDDNNIYNKESKNDYYNNNYATEDNKVNFQRTYVYQRRNPEEEELERQKRDIIRNIISEIFQDAKKLNLLKKELGDDIGEKLLSGRINEKELFKVVEILKKNQENIMKRKKVIQKKKFNQPSDKILLREKLNNKRYNYREYPRGWSSTKDYFINNGTTYIRDKRYKK